MELTSTKFSSLGMLSLSAAMLVGCGKPALKLGKENWKQASPKTTQYPEAKIRGVTFTEIAPGPTLISPIPITDRGMPEFNSRAYGRVNVGKAMAENLVVLRGGFSSENGVLMAVHPPGKYITTKKQQGAEGELPRIKSFLVSDSSPILIEGSDKPGSASGFLTDGTIVGGVFGEGQRYDLAFWDSNGKFLGEIPSLGSGNIQQITAGTSPQSWCGSIQPPPEENPSKKSQTSYPFRAVPDENTFKIEKLTRSGIAINMNQQGDTVGWYYTDKYEPRSFYWPKNGEAKLIPTPGGVFSLAHAVSEKGVVVGSYGADYPQLQKEEVLFVGTEEITRKPSGPFVGECDSHGCYSIFPSDEYQKKMPVSANWIVSWGHIRHAFMWSENTGFIDLNTLLSAEQLKETRIIDAWAIDSETILGSFLNKDGVVIIGTFQHPLLKKLADK